MDVLYGIRNLAEFSFELSRCMRSTDRQTNGQTDFDSNLIHVHIELDER